MDNNVSFRNFTVNGSSGTFRVLSRLNAVSLRSWDIWETLLLILLIFGTIGNTLTICVMRSKRMQKTNESLFITCIAIGDMSLLYIKFLVNMQKLYRIPIYDGCIFAHYVIPQTVAWFVYWLIVIITIERTLAVYKPFQINTIMSKKRCRLIVFTMLFIFTILSSTQIPCLEHFKKWPYFCSIKKPVNSTNEDFCFIYMNRVFPWIKTTLMSWLPWSLAVTFNGIIITSLFRATQLRKRISSELLFKRDRESASFIQSTIITNSPGDGMITKSINKRYSYSCHSLPNFNNSSPTFELRKEQRVRRQSNQISTFKQRQREAKEKQITITLCTISISFIVFTAPFAVFELLRKLNAETVTSAKQQQSLLNNRNVHRFVHFLVDCLHSTNFIFYCLIAERFRKELKRLIYQKFYVIFDKLNFVQLKKLVSKSTSAAAVHHVDYTNKRTSNEKFILS